MPDADYSRHYSDRSFWRKVQRYAKQAGVQVIEKALWLYYAAQRPETPAWAKGVIYGALGYFILPADAIPDMLPGVGLSDDLGALVVALGVVASHVTPDVKAQARQKLHDWFGPGELATHAHAR